MTHFVPSQQSGVGQWQTFTSWLADGAQLQAPGAQLFGKSEALAQQSAVPTVPPLAVQGSLASASEVAVSDVALSVDEESVEEESVDEESLEEESFDDESPAPVSCVAPSA